MEGGGSSHRTHGRRRVPRETTPAISKSGSCTHRHLDRDGKRCLHCPVRFPRKFSRGCESEHDIATGQRDAQMEGASVQPISGGISSIGPLTPSLTSHGKDTDMEGGSSSSTRLERGDRVPRKLNDTGDMEGGGCSSLGPLTPILAYYAKHKWKGSRYVDMDGWEVCDDTFSADEVSEETDDTFSEEEVSEESDAKKKSALQRTSAAALKPDVAHVSKKLSSTMMIGKEFHTSLTTRIELPPNDPKGKYLLTFDGYHRKNGKNGGYGALLRCSDRFPVAAIAGCSERWISPYYHALEGLLSGLDLVIAMNINKVSFGCNSQRVDETLSECFIFNHEGRCPRHPDAEFDLVCRPCLGRRLFKDEPLDLVYDIVWNIVKKGQRYYRSIGMTHAYEKERNMPADFLSKMVRNPGEEQKLAPEQFPEDLWTLIKHHRG